MVPLVLVLQYRIWISILLLSGLLINIGGCNSNTCETFKHDYLRINLPSTTKNLKERCWTGFNPTYEAEFAIAPQDLEILQGQAPLTKIDRWRSDTSSQIFTDSDLQKKGKQMQSLLYADYSDGVYLMQILIDTSNAQQYTVYFSNSNVD